MNFKFLFFWLTSFTVVSLQTTLKNSLNAKVRQNKLKYSQGIPGIIIASSSGTTTNANLVAKILGYVMGIGSMTIYTPILTKLISEKSSEGFSLQTWVFNALGLSLAAAYPFKKGFPLSTYIEIIILAFQALVILGVICHYNNQDKKFLLGLIPYSIYITVLIKIKLNEKSLQTLQIVSALVCNYANIPQIVLSYKQKLAVWSRATGLMSLGGNLIRVFTTINLTGDPFFLFGYILGAVTNGILFAQTFIYKRSK